MDKKQSHRLEIQTGDNRKGNRISLPDGNTVDVEKRNFFSTEDVGENQKIINISETGMQTLVRGEVKIGHKVKLLIDLREEVEPVEVLGIVRWVKPVPREIYHRVGIEFTKVPVGFKTRLENMLNDPLLIRYRGE